MYKQKKLEVSLPRYFVRTSQCHIYMTVNALIPIIARSSAAMLLTVYDQQALLLHREGATCTNSVFRNTF